MKFLTLGHGIDRLLKLGFGKKSGQEFRDELNAALFTSDTAAIKLIREWSGGDYSILDVKRYLSTYIPYVEEDNFIDLSFVVNKTGLNAIRELELETTNEYDLGVRLKKIKGVVEVDYDLFLGPKIFLKIDCKFNTIKIKQEAASEIYYFIEMAKNFDFEKYIKEKYEH